MKADNELTISSPQNHHHHFHQSSVQSLSETLPGFVHEKEDKNKHHNQRYSLYDKWTKHDKSKTAKPIFDQEEDQFKTKYSSNDNIQKRFEEQEDKLPLETKNSSVNVTKDIKKDIVISTPPPPTITTGIKEENVSSPVSLKTNLSGKWSCFVD